MELIEQHRHFRSAAVNLPQDVLDNGKGRKRGRMASVRGRLPALRSKRNSGADQRVSLQGEIEIGLGIGGSVRNGAQVGRLKSIEVCGFANRSGSMRSTGARLHPRKRPSRSPLGLLLSPESAPRALPRLPPLVLLISWEPSDVQGVPRVTW